jgi:hypothetical protein
MSASAHSKYVGHVGAGLLQNLVRIGEQALQLPIACHRSILYTEPYGSVTMPEALDQLDELLVSLGSTATK